MPQKNFLKYFLFFLILAAGMLLAAEWLLRATHLFGARISWSRPDAFIGWRFVPSRSFEIQEENPRRIRWSTNRFGWKDKEWAIKKPAKTYRVAVLGDSYVESLDMEPEKNFLQIAQNRLNAVLAPKGFQTEWMNFGRSGFTQTEELFVLKKDIAPFEPDLLVVFFFATNDIEDISPLTTTDPIRPYYFETKKGGLRFDRNFSKTRSFKIKSWISPIKNHSALVSLLTQRYSLLMRYQDLSKLRRKANRRTASPVKSYLSLCTRDPDMRYRKNYRMNKRLIHEMAKFAKRRGMEMLLVNVDLPSYQPEIEKSFETLDPSFNPLFFEKDLADFAGDLGIGFVGLQSVFRKEFLKNGRPLHWNYWGLKVKTPHWEYGAHDGHWNEEGHQVVGKTLAGALKSRLRTVHPV